MSHEMKGALPSRLFLALLSFRLCVAAGPSIAGHAWHPVTKPSSQNAPLQNVVTRSKIQCAGAANQKQDVSLFCYTDGGHCSLFGVPAKSFYDPAVDGETGPCWSRDPPPPSTTSSTATSTSTTAAPCTAPFHTLAGLEDLGCFYEDITLRSWSSGRSYCQVIGGDMAVFDTSTDFLRLADYYSAQTTVTGIWVGVYNRVWLSGRTPSSSEWYSSEPNGSDLCVDLRSGYGFLLGDTGCSIGHMTLCKAY